MKYTSKLRKSFPTASQPEVSDNRNGISATPPEYRIDFVDNATGFATFENSGSAPVIQTERTLDEGCVTCTQSVAGNQPPIQRQELEEDKAVQMVADAPQMERMSDEAQPAVKEGIQQARGSGQPLDDSLQNRMSAEYDYNFDGVRVHTGAEADGLNRQLGARAFTTGSNIFFKQGQYEPASTSGQKLIAHELSHVGQQRTGRVRGSGEGLTVRPSGEAFEREADARARHSVFAGHKGRKGPVASGRSMSFSKGQQFQKAGNSAVQRYVDQTDTDGDPWRVSESGDTALWVEQAEGGQTLFGTPKQVKQANLKLAKAGKNGSFIRLKATGYTLKSGLLKGVSSGVRAVAPRLVTIGPDPDNVKLAAINLGLRADDDGSKSKEFALWADCGRSSRAVMGIDDSGSMPRAHVKVDRKARVTARSGGPVNFTINYRAAMPGFMKAPSSRKYLKKGVHYKLDAKNNEIMKTPADDKEAKKMYWKLGPKGRRAFDFHAGINVAVDPEIGGGKHRYPGGYEREGVVIGIGRHHRLDAAAMSMTEHHQVLHAEAQYREFQCRAGAVKGAFLFHGRNQIGDIADDEQVARVRLKQYRRIDAGIGTRHHRHLRVLAAGDQVLDQRPALLIGPIAELPVTLEQFVDSSGHECNASN